HIKGELGRIAERAARAKPAPPACRCSRASPMSLISFVRTSSRRERGHAGVRLRLARAAIAMAAASVSCASAPRPLPGQTVGLPPEKAPPPMVGHNLLLNEAFDNPKKSLPWNASFTD